MHEEMYEWQNVCMKRRNDRCSAMLPEMSAGKDMIMEIQRRNQHLAYLTYDRLYSYDSPQVQT